MSDAESMHGATPTRRVSQFVSLLRPSVLTALLAALACSLPEFLPAAETITAHLGPDGKVVFVNEEAPPNSAGSRRVVASTSGGESPVGGPEMSIGSSEGIFLEPASGVFPATPPGHIDALIDQAARRHHVDPDLIRAMIRVESNFDPYAVSPKGARGLMQLIPATAMRFGVANPFDPGANIDGGIRYLKHLLGMYQGDLQLSLAAYNAGEQAVARSGGIPAYRETRNYIRKIGELYPLRPIPVGIPPEPTIEKFVDSKGVVHFSNLDRP